jgi:hypothetical protein
MAKFALENGVVLSDPPDWRAVATEFKRISDDPFTDIDVAKKARRLAKLGGLGTFPRIYHALLREGRFDRAIRRTSRGFEWYWREGSSADAPGAGPKLEYVNDWLDSNPGEQLVLGAGGKQTVMTARRLLDSKGISYHVIEGGTTGRAALVDSFQAGEVRVMLLQQVAGAESVQLTAAATSMLIDLDLKTTSYTQFIHRVYRQGQLRDSVHVDMTMGTIQERLLDGIRRGRAFDQRMRDEIEREARLLGAVFG